MSKIYLATRDQAVLHATSVTINQSTIVLGGIQLPVDNQLITFTLSATIDSPEFISIDNISYPLRNASNAMVESLLESVCYSATYSNGYFFVMLGGGGGKIEQFTRNQETIFPTADGQHTFTLTKGVYSVGSNCLDVTVMGVPQPHSAFTEDSETQFTLNSSFIITKDTQIDVSYMLVSTMSNAETPKGAQMKVDALETEIDGKLATIDTNINTVQTNLDQYKLEVDDSFMQALIMIIGSVLKATATVSGSVITLIFDDPMYQGAPVFLGHENCVITFTLPSIVANPTITIGTTNYPVKDTSNEPVEELIGGVCYSLTYAGSCFFTKTGGGVIKIPYTNSEVDRVGSGVSESSFELSSAFNEQASSRLTALTGNKILVSAGARNRYAIYDAATVTLSDPKTKVYWSYYSAPTYDGTYAYFNTGKAHNAGSAIYCEKIEISTTTSTKLPDMPYKATTNTKSFYVEESNKICICANVPATWDNPNVGSALIHTFDIASNTFSYIGTYPHYVGDGYSHVNIHQLNLKKYGYFAGGAHTLVKIDLSSYTVSDTSSSGAPLLSLTDIYLLYGHDMYVYVFCRTYNSSSGALVEAFDKISVQDNSVQRLPNIHSKYYSSSVLNVDALYLLARHATDDYDYVDCKKVMHPGGKIHRSGSGEIECKFNKKLLCNNGMIYEPNIPFKTSLPMDIEFDDPEPVTGYIKLSKNVIGY